MTPNAPSTTPRWTTARVGLAAGLVVALAALMYFAAARGLVEAAEAAVARLRDAGPAVFFVAMALLPAVGFPMIAFTLAAGPVFGPQLGAGWVTACSVAAVVGNLLLTYWLANLALRPLVVRLLSGLRISLPENVADGAWQMTLIVRLTPGPPFWAQSYLLGLLRVPLAPYLVVSTTVMAGYIAALVYGGEAIVRGNGRLAAGAIGALAVFVAVLQLVRKRIARRRAGAAVSLPVVPVMAVK